MSSATKQGERHTRTELGRYLLGTGAMTPDWEPAFAAVDRALFLPDVMWPFEVRTNRHTSVTKADDPAEWYRCVDANVPITTQWDDGHHTGIAVGKTPTSSTSAPSVVLSMLRDLDVQPGHRVLEIGTGTGWNAGLLAYRLGDTAVTTVEVDAAVTAQARSALHQAGLHPTVVTYDGLLGYPPNAPYDLVIVTCGMRSIPAAWVRQTAPGGVILAPWGTAYTHRDAVVRLVVAGDGTASGHFTMPVEFMKARSQRVTRPRHGDYLPAGFPGDAETSGTTLTGGEGLDGPFSAFEFAASLRVRDCAHAADRRGDAQSVWFYGLGDRSWAAVLFREGVAESTVYQSGPRRLWDEVETAYLWWVRQDRPGHDRFGLTVTADGEQRAWLNDPEQSWAV